MLASALTGRCRRSASCRESSPGPTSCRRYVKASRRQRPRANLPLHRRLHSLQGAERARRRRNRTATSVLCSCRSTAAQRPSRRRKNSPRSQERGKRRAKPGGARPPRPHGCAITSPAAALAPPGHNRRDSQHVALIRWFHGAQADDSRALTMSALRHEWAEPGRTERQDDQSRRLCSSQAKAS